MKVSAAGPGKRMLVLLAVAAVVGVLAFTGDEQAPTPVAAVSRASVNANAGEASAVRRDIAKKAAAAAPKALALQRLERPAPADSKSDLFASAFWSAPPKPPAPIAAANLPPPGPPEPPPKPRPPAIPFQYFGHLVDGETQSVFLTQGPRNHVVKVGDTIDGAYRVEAINPQRIVFRYLPLDETQELPRGAAP